MSRIQEIFAANLRAYRKQARLTQEELAERSGLHRTYIGGIEQQRINVSLKNIEKIASALGVDPALLFIKNDSALSVTNMSHQAFTDNQQTSDAMEERYPPQYALCTVTADGITLKPLNVHDENLTISILCSLINGGYDGTLTEAYNRAQQQIIAFLRDKDQSPGS